MLQRMHGDEREELAEALPGKIAERLFPAAQHQVHFHLMSFLQEFLGLFGAKFEIVTAGFEADAEHFNLAYPLALRAVFPFLLRLDVLKLAEVHYLDNRRTGGRRDLDNVEPPLFGDAECVFQRELTDVLAGFVNGADARGADLIVDAVTAEDSG